MRTITTLAPFAVAAALASASAAQFLEPATLINTLTSDQTVSSFGWAIAKIEDLDGDGAIDLVVGEVGFFADPMDPFPVGRVSVYSGADGTLLHRVTPASGGRLGYAVADAGDIDGDGVNDFIGGAPFRFGLVGGADVFSGATGAPILTIAAPNGGFFGESVAGVSDINGDNVPDLLIGASSEDTAGRSAGRAYVCSGADGAILREYAPASGPEEFGAGAASAGDIDGDGVDEHIIGAPRPGKAYLFNGADGALLNVFTTPSNTGRYGEFFVDGLRDVDGDDIRDLYVGDYAFNADPSTGLAPGAAYVYSGADYSTILEFNGPTATSGLGPGRGAGDIDGDGREDLIIGHFSSSESVAMAGRVSVYSGATGSELRRFTGTIANAQLGFDCVGIGDVDSDGEIDFALSAANGGLVYLAAGAAPCPADLDDSGAVDAVDLAALIAAWGAAGSPADLDGDGTVGAADLAALISAWGSCD